MATNNLGPTMTIIYNHNDLRKTQAYQQFDANKALNTHVDIECKTFTVFRNETYHQCRITPKNNHNNPYVMQYPFTEEQFSKVVARAAYTSHKVIPAHVKQEDLDPNEWKPDLIAEELIIYPSGYTVLLNDRVMSVSNTIEEAEEMEKVFMTRVFERRSILTLGHFKTLDFAKAELEKKLGCTFKIGEPNEL